MSASSEKQAFVAARLVQVRLQDNVPSLPPPLPLILPSPPPSPPTCSLRLGNAGLCHTLILSSSRDMRCDVTYF